MKEHTTEIFTEVGLLDVVLVPDEKLGGYTAFFTDENWSNLVTEGDTIAEAVANLDNLLHIVVKYKKDRQSCVNFGEWIRVNATPKVQGHWYVEQHGHVKDTDALYDLYVAEKDKKKDEKSI